jgi:hypothetical protein
MRKREIVEVCKGLYHDRLEINLSIDRITGFGIPAVYEQNDRLKNDMGIIATGVKQFFWSTCAEKEIYYNRQRVT